MLKTHHYDTERFWNIYNLVGLSANIDDFWEK